MGQVATNVKITSGELRPLGATTLASATAKERPALSVYQARDGLYASAWFTWPYDVDVVRAPLPVEVEARLYWTGDGAPKYATYSDAIASGLNDYPSNYFTLGMPVPITAPAVTSSGGVGLPVSRLYGYTFFSELGEESAISPVSAVVTGKEDDVWSITGMDNLPANDGAITDVTYDGTTVTLTSAVKHFTRVGEIITVAGVTTVANVNGTWTLTAVDTAAKTMTFAVDTTPTGTYVDATDSTDTWTRSTAWNVSNMKRRLYRSAGTLAAMQLVDDDVGTSYNDTILEGTSPETS